MKETTKTRVLLGFRIRQLRKGKGLTQEQLVAKINISRAALSPIERGEGNPKVSTLEQIAEVLNVPVRDLFWFESENP